MARISARFSSEGTDVRLSFHKSAAETRLSFHRIRKILTRIDFWPAGIRLPIWHFLRYG